MKTMLLAAATVLSLGVGSAFAGDSEGQATIYTGAVQDVPIATAQSGQAVHTFVTHSNQGTYLFPPAQGGNG